jgi:hypothetical protein
METSPALAASRLLLTTLHPVMKAAPRSLVIHQKEMVIIPDLDLEVIQASNPDYALGKRTVVGTKSAETEYVWSRVANLAAQVTANAALTRYARMEHV